MSVHFLRTAKNATSPCWRFKHFLLTLCVIYVLVPNLGINAGKHCVVVVLNINIMIAVEAK